MTTKDPATRGALSRDASMLAPRRPKITGAPKEAQPARSTQSASATLPASAGIRERTPSRSVSPITITCHRVATQMRACDKEARAIWPLSPRGSRRPPCPPAGSRGGGPSPRQPRGRAGPPRPSRCATPRGKPPRPASRPPRRRAARARPSRPSATPACPRLRRRLRRRLRSRRSRGPSQNARAQLS